MLGRHPKFQALVTFLQRYSDQPAFHGIVFTRTREGARSVTQLLAAAPALDGVQVRGCWGGWWLASHACC